MTRKKFISKLFHIFMITLMVMQSLVYPWISLLPAPPGAKAQESPPTEASHSASTPAPSPLDPLLNPDTIFTSTNSAETTTPEVIPEATPSATPEPTPETILTPSSTPSASVAPSSTPTPSPTVSSSPAPTPTTTPVAAPTELPASTQGGPTNRITDLLISPFSISIQYPFAGSYPTSYGFGQRSPNNYVALMQSLFGVDAHDGLDFAMPIGTEILSTSAGTIISAGPGLYGTTIQIEHSWGTSYYGHLSDTSVQAGDKVKAGQIIGYSGNSGVSTGPHLHFGIRPVSPNLLNGYHGMIDPAPYLQGIILPKILGTKDGKAIQNRARVRQIKNKFALAKNSLKNDDISIKVNFEKGESSDLNIVLKNPKGSEIDITDQTLGTLTGPLGPSLDVNLTEVVDLVPGLYQLTITDAQGNYETQDFTWGVLAINTNKTIYLPSTPVDFSMAVLDNQGDMVCDAQVDLSITSPSGQVTKLSSTSGEVTVNLVTCLSKTYTLNPDYQATFHPAELGNYEVNMSTTTADGTRSISSSFRIAEYVPFDVERVTITRIYPRLDYPVILRVHAFEDFVGTVEDVIPANFELVKPSGDQNPEYTVSSRGDTQVLSWNVVWQKGGDYVLTYQFNPPDKSPDFYTFGPLKIGNRFSEIKKWQLAIDVTTTIILNYAHTILTSGTTWTVPADWTDGDNTIEVIGGGGAGRTDTSGAAGAGGGGGGAYAKSVNIALTPGASIDYQIGHGGIPTSVNGTDTFFNRTAGTAGTCADTTSACAKGGTGATSATGAAGGLASSSFATGTGNVKNNGGTGGTGNTTADSGGGGGGAGGPNGAGGTGGAGDTDNTTDGVGGGGGGNGGGAAGGSGITSDTVGANGGNGNGGTGGGTGGTAADGANGTAGTGGGGGGGSDNMDGGHGANGSDLVAGVAVGSGGGGGGTGDTATTTGMGGNGGLYGAGGGGGRYGGFGAPGVIIITYNGNTPTKNTWVVPADWNSADNTVTVIGGGGAGVSAAQGTGAAGGGGGGYSSISNLSLTPGASVAYQVGEGGRKVNRGAAAGAAGTASFFNRTAGTAGTCADTVSVCANPGAAGSGTTGGAGGSTTGADGTTLLAGGAGGAGNSTGDTSGGGGGAGGATIGNAGGAGPATTPSAGGGGGGGAGGGTSSAGQIGQTTTGGTGGNGPAGTGGGAAGNAGHGGAGTAATGGGGGGGDDVFGGGEGGSGSSTTYGGGGGGGAGDNNTAATSAAYGGHGGLHGGAGGGGLTNGFGAEGIIIITYTPVEITIGGTANGNDGATVKWAKNGTVQAETGTISASAWSITTLASPPTTDDIITVWVDGVADASESTAVTKWTGSVITGMVLNTNVVSVGSNQNTSLSLTNLETYDCTQDEDIMYQAASSILKIEGDACAGSTTNSYSTEKIDVLSGNTLTLTTSEALTTYDLTISGTLTSSGNSAYSLSHDFVNNGTFTASTSTVTFNGSTAQAISGSSTTSFSSLTNTNTTAELTASTNFNISGTLNLNGAATTLNPSAAVVINNSGAAGTITGSGTAKVTRTTATADYSSQYKFTTNTLTNLTIDYTGSGQILSNLTYGGLKISGSIATGSNTAAIGGVFTTTGTFTPSAGTLTFNNGSSIVNSGTLSFYNLTIAGSATVTTSSSFTVIGNWSSSGTFTASAGTITLSAGLGSTQTVSGNNSFYNLTSTNITSWYNPAWLYRQKITIDHTKVPSDQTDFPLYINLNNLPSSFHTNVNQTDARDLRFTKVDGTTELPREVVYYTAATDTGEAYVKYAGTLSSTVDTDIFVYYGNTAATDYAVTDTYGRNNVWSGYEATYHMNENAQNTCGTDDVCDSSGTGNNLASQGTAGFTTSSKIGAYATLYDGTDDYFDNATSWFNSLTAYTMEGWFSADTLNGADANQYPIMYNLGGESLYPRMHIRGDGALRLQQKMNGLSFNVNTAAGVVTAATWYHIAVTFDTSNFVRIFVNGSQVGSGQLPVGTMDVGSTGTFKIGHDNNLGLFFLGKADEYRVSATNNSPDYITAQYNNQSSPSTFYSMNGSEGSGGTARTIQFTSGSTQTITNAWTVTGSDGAMISLSGSAASAWTINPTAATVDYATITYSTNTGVNFCATHSIDGGNNSGWNLTCTPTANSFQRKTWHDGTRYWRSSFDINNQRLMFEYSTDGSSWTENTSARITTSNSDYSLEGDSTNLFVVYTTSGDIKGRTVTSYPGTTFGWGSEQVILNGTGATDNYSYPVISRDSASKVWVAARFTGAGVYYLKTIKETTTANDLPEDSGDTVYPLSDTSNTSSNVYGNLVSTGSSNMYATFTYNANISGCKWVDSSTTWQDSSGNSCLGGSSSITQVQVKHQYTATSNTNYAFTSNNTLHNFIVVFVSGTGSEPSTMAITDTQGNTYTPLTLNQSNGTYAQIFYAADINGGANSVKATYTNWGDVGMTAVEYSGIATTSPLDVEPTPSYTSTSSNVFTSNSFNPQTGSLIFAGWANENNDPGTITGTGMTVFAQDAGHYDAQAHNLSATTGSQTVSFNSVNSIAGDSTVNVATFLSAAASQDSIATGLSGLSNTLSSVSDASGNVHLTYINSSGNVMYAERTTSWQTPVTLDSNASNSYPTVSLNTSNNNLYAFWIRNNDIFYKKGVSTYASGNWDASATSWQAAGTNTNLSSSYSGGDKVFAQWYDGTTLDWDKLTIISGGNTAPNSPTALAQTTTGDVTISTGGWVSSTSVKFNVTATDTDNPDTLYLCIEKDVLGVGFSNTEDSCGSGVAYSGSGVTLTHTITSQTDASEYHWQARVKDTAGEYSAWVAYGANAESARDYGLDTTAPTGGTVYDGSGAGVDVSYSDSSLSALSANWASINSDVSGLVKYEYSIGTSAGATDVKTWTDNTTSTSVTATGLTLQSSIPYYVNVRTTDGAGNVSTPISSNGQRVAPSISFTIAPATLTFSNLNFANSYTDTQATTLTTSTNAYNGYVLRAFTTDLLRSADTLTTIADFSAGSYATPATWAGAETGFGYTSSDTTIGGSNKFGTATLYAPFSHTGPGDIVADHTNTVSGSPVSNEVFTLTYKVKVPASQAAKSYAATVIYTATAQY